MWYLVTLAPCFAPSTVNIKQQTGLEEVSSSCLILGLKVITSQVAEVRTVLAGERVNRLRLQD